MALPLLPWHAAKYAYWHTRWFVKFTVRKDAYGAEEIEYLTIKTCFKGSRTGWNSLPEAQQCALMAKRLWEPANMKREEEEQRKEFQRRHPEKYKQWVRQKRHYKPDLGCGCDM